MNWNAADRGGDRRVECDVFFKVRELGNEGTSSPTLMHVR